MIIRYFDQKQFAKCFKNPLHSLDSDSFSVCHCANQQENSGNLLITTVYVVVVSLLLNGLILM